MLEAHVYSARLLFLIGGPIRRPCSFTLNAVAVNCQSVLSCAGACLLTNGLEERSKESSVRASQHCAAAAVRGDVRGKDRERGKDGGGGGGVFTKYCVFLKVH